MAFVKDTGFPHPSSVPIDGDGKKAASKNPASTEWPIKAVATLLDMYVEKFFAGRGYLRGNDWEEVRTKVNAEFQGLKTLKSIKQCRDKVDSLKRRYKIEKRKAISGSEITWPFFTKLDNMMSCVFKHGKGIEPVDGQQKPSLCYSREDGEEDGSDEGDQDGSDDCDHKRSLSSSHEKRSVDKNGSKQLGLSLFMDQNVNSRRIEAADMFRLVCLKKKKAEDSSETSSEKGTRKTWREPESAGMASKNQAQKMEPDAENPMQALTDALTGFSEVYARVELTKMEIISRMKLELAKLGRKRKRKHMMKDYAACPK